MSDQVYKQGFGYGWSVGDKYGPQSVSYEDQLPTEIMEQFLSVVEQGNLKEIIEYIHKYNIVVKKVIEPINSQTCLFYAAVIKLHEAALEVMKFLLDQGINANFTDKLNQTALYFSAREGNTPCIELLISHGCNVNHRDQNGQTALYYSAREGHYESTKRLIEAGTDINNEDNNGQSALFYAAKEGKADICQLLIKYNIFVNKQDNKKQTALSIAKRRNKTEVVKILLANGANNVTAEEVKERPNKRGENELKRDTTDNNNATKKYVLCSYVNGEWKQLTPFEVQEYLHNNVQEASCLLNKGYIESLKAPLPLMSSKIYYHWDMVAKKILNHMWKQSGSRIFYSPVDPHTLNVPDYHQIIKNPMDFGTIREKLKGMMYGSCEEFVKDMETVFGNCIAYNGETSKFGLLAKNLKAEFTRQCQVYSLGIYMKGS